MPHHLVGGKVKSMRFGVIGLGQMGSYYLANLIEKLRISSEQIVVWDIDATKISAALKRYPGIRVARTFEEFATNADVFFVLVNTPAHHIVIEQLAQTGARRILLETGFPPILSEKPIAQNVTALKQVRAIERRYKDLQIFTALVIAWSPVREVIAQLMREKDLVLREFTGSWGKNRAVETEMRPTAGDRVDEFIHMIEFGMSLMPSVSYADVFAQIGFLKYANEEVQRTAHARDSSFPLRPDNSTHALIRVAPVSGDGHLSEVRMSLESSFIKAVQIRHVEGLLAHANSDDPAYAFAIEFDRPDGDDLVITELRSNTVQKTTLKSDKLLTLTAAFLAAARGEYVDPRLASVEWAGFFVYIMDAIEKSHAKNRIERVHFGQKTLLERWRA